MAISDRDPSRIVGPQPRMVTMSSGSTLGWIATSAGQATAYVALWLALTEFLKRDHFVGPAKMSVGSVAVLAAVWCVLLAYRLWRERPA